jgi:hypothetical protein
MSITLSELKELAVNIRVQVNAGKDLTYEQQATLLEGIRQAVNDPPAAPTVSAASQVAPLPALALPVSPLHPALLRAMYDSLHSFFGHKDKAPDTLTAAAKTIAEEGAKKPDLKPEIAPAKIEAIPEKEPAQVVAVKAAPFVPPIAPAPSTVLAPPRKSFEENLPPPIVPAKPAPEAPKPASDIPSIPLADGPPAVTWVASPNFNEGRGAKIDLIVIHDCEGGFDSATRTFMSKESQVSAHFVVSEDGQTVRQMVARKDKAWHARAFNSRSLGLEMAGFEAKGMSDGEWKTEALLTAWLCHQHGVPPIWSKSGLTPGISRHLDLGAAGGGHHDPTTDATVWNKFMAQVQAFCIAADFPASWSAIR